MKSPKTLIKTTLVAAFAAIGLCLGGCGISDFVSSYTTERPVITSVKVFEPATASDAKSDRDVVDAPAPDYISPIGGDYYRSKLNEFEQSVYDELKNGFMSFYESIDITDCSPDIAERCYKAVLADAPDIFWVDTSYQYMITQDRSTVVSIQPDLTYSENEAAATSKKMKTEAKDIIESIPADAASDYQKARYLFEKVSTMLRYDEAMADFQDLGTVFNEKVSVCGGYAKLYQYLCREAGIECVYLIGYADVDGEEILHAWNMLDLDGTICYADATWGDKDEMLPVDFSWMGLTYNSISASHRANDENIVIQEANDPRYEIWAMNSSYYEQYDEQTVLARMIESAGSGESSLVMKFATPEMLDMARNFIKDNSYPATRVYESFPDSFPVAYTEGVYKAYEIKDLNAIKIIWRH